MIKYKKKTIKWQNKSSCWTKNNFYSLNYKWFVPFGWITKCRSSKLGKYYYFNRQKGIKIEKENQEE